MTIGKLDAPVLQDRAMAREPRSDGPRRRTFSPAEKLALLAGYETAMETGQGNGFLREHGLYSSLISEWRRTRDAGLLRGKPAGSVVGRPSADQAEIARLRRELDVAQRRLARTESALVIMGKAQELLEDISESTGTPPPSIPR
jgi:transposase-like protein